MKPSIKTKYLDTISHVFICTLHALFQKYDIIHFHSVGPSLMSFIPRLFLRKTRIVGTFHCQDRFHQKWGPFARQVLKLGEFTICKFPHTTIAISHIIQKHCKKRFNRKAVYIPYGITISDMIDEGEIKKFGLKKDDYIFTAARFVKHKGIHYLIEAYNRMKTDKKLVIAGDAPYPSTYKEQIKKLAETNPNIIFTGYQKGKTLAQLFKNAYLYVHPSEAEGLSITILEALSFGKCALVSDIPENLEAINGFGFSFKNKNVKDLEVKLSDLLNKPDLVKQTGIKAKKYVEENYNWDNIAKKTENLYQSLLKKS